jgi:hypothetical protein
MTIEQHRASPEVSLDEHVRRCQIALARTLEHKQAIYLDVKYWIIVRDIAAGVRTSALELKLFDLLRELTASEKTFCPISESTLVEVLKQKCSSRRT